MIEIVVAIALAAAAAALAVALVAMRRPTRWLDQTVRRRVVVHTLDGETLSGLLLVVAEDGIVLDPAQLHDAAEPTALAGGAFVPRGRIKFTQHPDAAHRRDADEAGDTLQP